MNNPNSKQLNKPPLNIGIVGFGAIGCLLSSQIPVHMKVFALPSDPKLTTVHFRIDKDHHHKQFSFPVWQDEILDVVILCCKATQCHLALDLWQDAISKDSQIVLLQNGMGQHEQVESRFPNHVIFAASTTEGAFKKDKHTVVHAGQGVTQWGSYSAKNKNLSTALKLDISLFKGKHQWSNDIESVLIAKLALNAIINPLTVKYNCHNGVLVNDPIIAQELKNLCNETEVFFRAMQWPLDFDLTEKVTSVAQLTAKNSSSMRQDIQVQRETEVDFINGYLLRQANIINYTLPRHQALFNFIKSLH
jgi:2-dehydropantoate 2-reductase